MPKRLPPLSDDLHAEEGRPGIPPEQRLKARRLTALHGVRGERPFSEQPGYHLLWLWFLDREFGERSFNPSVLAKNHPRVLSADVARLFSAKVHDLSHRAGWTRDEPSTADGTPIEPRASLKGFVRKDDADARKVASTSPSGRARACC